MVFSTPKWKAVGADAVGAAVDYDYLYIWLLNISTLTVCGCVVVVVCMWVNGVIYVMCYVLYGLLLMVKLCVYHIYVYICVCYGYQSDSGPTVTAQSGRCLPLFCVKMVWNFDHLSHTLSVIYLSPSLHHHHHNNNVQTHNVQQQQTWIQALQALQT